MALANRTAWVNAFDSYHEDKGLKNSSSQVLFIPELLGRILLFAGPEIITSIGDLEITENRIPNYSTHPPWPMMLVCRFWYSVVTTTPALWTTFIGIFHTCSAEDMVHVPSMFDAHVRFSKQLPLNICFYLSADRWTQWANVSSKTSVMSQTELMHVLLGKARACQSRWQRFSIRVDSKSRLTEAPLWLMELVNDPVHSQLKHLKMGARIDPGQLGPFNPHPQRPSLNLPPYRGLETLSISGAFLTSVSQTGQGLQAPFFPSLRVLRFEYTEAMSIQGLWRILKEAPYLEKAYLDMDNANPAALSVVSVANLRRLRLFARPFHVAMGILVRMRLPSLIELTFDNILVRDRCLRQLAQTLSSLRAPLKVCSFSVYDAVSSCEPLSPEALGEVFRSLEQLEDLDLGLAKPSCLHSLPSSMFHALASMFQTERDTFLPCLTRLTIDVNVNSMLTDHHSAAGLRTLISACRKKYQTCEHRFCFRIKSSESATGGGDFASFQAKLVGDPVISECLDASNFEVLVKERWHYPFCSKIVV